MSGKFLLEQAKQKIKQNPADGKAHYDLALLLDESGDLEQSVPEYEKAIRYDAEPAQAYFDLGLVYTRLKKYAEAVRAWLKIIDSDGNLRLDKISYSRRLHAIQTCTSLWERYVSSEPFNALSYFNAGAAFMFLGNYEKSKDIFQILAKQAPNFEMINYYLGIVLSLLGEREKAITHLRQELRQKPGNVPVMFSLGETLFKQGKTQNAINQFEDIIALKPDHILARFNLAMAYARQNRFIDAQAALETVIKADPAFARAHFEKAKVFEKQFQIDNAADEYIKALTINPDYKEAHFDLACAYKKMGKPQLALEHFTTVLEFNPADDEVHYSLGEVYIQLGKFNEAVKEYKMVLELSPNHAYAHYSLGVACLRMNKLLEAAESFKKALELNPNDTSARNMLGTTYFKLGNLSASVEEFQTILKQNPMDIQAHYYLGAVYFKLQDFSRAIEEYQKIAQINPESAYAYFSLGAAFSRSGDFENAATQFQRAAELMISSEVDLVLFATLQLLAVIGVEHAQQGKKVGELYLDLEQAYKDTVKSLAKAVDARDPYTRYHSERVSKLAGYLAREMKLPEEEIKKIEIAGYMHDIGKIGIPDEILLKADSLTTEEQKMMRTHPVRGAEILKEVKFLWNIMPLVKCHHEKIDGSGYPQGLKKDEIPLGAKIIGVVDFYDALTTDRPYRKAVTYEEALEEVKKIKGTFYDDYIVDAFLKVSNNFDSLLKYLR